MGQVPHTSYLAIGGGRMARHMTHFLCLEQIPFETWTRHEPLTLLKQKARAATHILVLITDSAIEPFIQAHPQLADDGRVVLHFSGSLATPLAFGTHPLMTFAADRLYDLPTYREMPFVVEKNPRAFSELLPGLTNPHYEIDAADKPLYHALCAMAGNFTVLLWEKLFLEFERTLGLSREAARPFLKRIAENLASNEGSVLTGPLARGDYVTIDKHLRALAADPYRDVYQTFVHAFQKSSAAPRGDS